MQLQLPVMLLFSQAPVVPRILPNPRLEARQCACLSKMHVSARGGRGGRERVTTWHKKIGETWVLAATQAHECIFFYKGGEEKNDGERSVCSRQKSHCVVKLYIHIRNLNPPPSHCKQDSCNCEQDNPNPTILHFYPQINTEKSWILLFCNASFLHSGRTFSQQGHRISELWPADTFVAH